MKISSLSISGLLTLNMHALNNEGSEGNYLQTRMVEIVDANGAAHSVNAISGDMFKHIQADHLYSIAGEEGIALCNGCSSFNPNRINIDNRLLDEYKQRKGVTNSEIVDWVIRNCIGDDIEGTMITQNIGLTAAEKPQSRSIGRKSVIEFGWAIGEPEKTKTESYFHVKFDQTERASGRGDDKTGANIGQNIFHRPASSGRYAIVMNTDLYRVGFNDITRIYSISPDERKKRAIVTLKSILATFLKPEGAHRNTQNPHIVNFQGCITASSTTLPAPTISALNNEYLEEIKGICSTLNELSSNSITEWEFNSLQEFVATIKEIINSLEI
jgi:CRISPR-associated protein Cst2